MTKQEYEKIIKIIEKNMEITHDNPYKPRVVLTANGFSNVKQELKELIKE